MVTVMKGLVPGGDSGRNVASGRKWEEVGPSERTGVPWIPDSAVMKRPTWVQRRNEDRTDAPQEENFLKLGTSLQNSQEQFE